MRATCLACLILLCWNSHSINTFLTRSCLNLAYWFVYTFCVYENIRYVVCLLPYCLPLQIFIFIDCVIMLPLISDL
jgi:hypothetical protein